MKRRSPDPGRKATPEEAGKAFSEAHQLLVELLPLNLEKAAEYIRNNSPSAEAIAVLAFHAHDQLTRARNRYVAKESPRRSRLPYKLKEAHRQGRINLETDSAKEVARKAPELAEVGDRGIDSLKEAISKLKKRSATN
jgi:hypothetical protein